MNPSTHISNKSSLILLLMSMTLLGVFLSLSAVGLGLNALIARRNVALKVS
nr:hypothetical protein [uncultured Pseudomonas sp.]